MPRYFFHPDTPTGCELVDGVGSLLGDDEAALEEAMGSVRDLTRLAPWDWRGCAFRVVDEAGRHVVTVQFYEVLARSRPIRLKNTACRNCQAG